MEVSGVTVTVTVPTLVVSWWEVAVTVTLVLAVTACAVNKPELLMVPALLPHVTVESKVPVPVTVAAHWLVAPVCTVLGVHVTVTVVMAELLLEPPPQAAIPRRPHQATIRARARKPFPRDLRSTASHTVNEYPSEEYLP
jgi:hypothetical protein